MNISALKALAADALRFNRWPIALIVAYVACAEVAAHAYGFKNALGGYNDVWIVLNLTAFAFVLAVLVGRGLIAHKPERPFPFARDLLVNDWKIGRRIAYALPMFVLLPVFFSSFSSIKSAIGVMQPYHLDPLFVRWDRAVFLGHDPWSVLQPLLGWPVVTFALNFFYNLWFFLLYLVLAFVTVSIGRPLLRNQFLVALVLCCGLIGSLGAVLFASVGPCFYGAFYPHTPPEFAAMTVYLQAANTHFPIWALETQHMLLQSALTGKAVMGSGISAMPSVHVSLAMLMAILGWKVSRPAGIAGSVFLALILLASVHLGWHYAVDGLASLAATPLIWLASGWLVRLKAAQPSFAPVVQPA